MSRRSGNFSEFKKNKTAVQHDFNFSVKTQYLFQTICNSASGRISPNRKFSAALGRNGPGYAQYTGMSR